MFIVHHVQSLLVFINDKTLFFRNMNDRKVIKTTINNLLEIQAKSAWNRMYKAFKDIEMEVKNVKLQLNLVQSAISRAPDNILDPRRANGLGRSEQAIMNFLNRYVLLWKDYKNRYLFPDIYKYYKFAKHLERIDGEKWVINFYQTELFPKLRTHGGLAKSIKTISEGMLSTGTIIERISTNI